MGLVGKRHLRSAEAAKGARWDGVRINGIGVGEHMRNAIGTVRTITCLFSHRGPRVGVGAAVEVHLALARHKGPVFLHARFDGHLRPWLTNRFECLIGTERKPDGPPGDPRQARCDAFGLDAALGAIAAAHVGNDDAHGAERKAEDPRQFLPDRKWALGRRPDLQNLPVELRHANMGLHGIVLRAREGERIFKDKI